MKTNTKGRIEMKEKTKTKDNNMNECTNIGLDQNYNQQPNSNPKVSESETYIKIKRSLESISAIKDQDKNKLPKNSNT